jgi:hypothetical protein
MIPSWALLAPDVSFRYFQLLLLDQVSIKVDEVALSVSGKTALGTELSQCQGDRGIETSPANS